MSIHRYWVHDADSVPQFAMDEEVLWCWWLCPDDMTLRAIPTDEVPGG